MTATHKERLVKELGNGLSVVPAREIDTDNVWKIIKSCSDWLLNTKGLDHWANYYTRETVEKKVKTQEVYLVYRDNIVVGTFTLDQNPVEYYTPVDLSHFANPHAKAMYISAVAVDPALQGQGVAGRIMELADEITRSRGIAYLRFDCRAEYTDLVNFYLKRNYQKVGSFSEGDNQNYFLMEKELVNLLQ